VKRQEGSVILLVLLVSAVFAVLAPVAGTIATSEARIARSHAVQTTALYIAEAGVELAVARLREEPGFTGNFSGILGGGSFTVRVSGGSASLAERIIDSTGVWGGGQRRAAARVSFSQTQAPLQSFLFQHTFLSGDTSARINDSTITGPVRVGGFHSNGNEGNTFLPPQSPPAQPVIDPQAGGRIPAVDFEYYVRLADANRQQWYVVCAENSVPFPDSTTNLDDLDAAVRAANALHPRRERILINAGGNRTVTWDKNSSLNFEGLIVINAKEVKLQGNININNANRLAILTTGDIDVGPGLGNTPESLGNHTLLYSNGRVEVTLANNNDRRLEIGGIIVAKGAGSGNSRDIRNATLTFNNSMLPLLERDAQPNFRQQAAATVMNVTFTSPGP